jgi:processive 1,2-diacylglycerol beta-glucosyltransferase
MFDKVLILSASAGAGHLRAAEAVEKAMIERRAAKEIRNVDVLRYTNRVFRNLYSKAYLELVSSAPDVLGWLYDYLDQPWKKERRRLALDRLNTRPLVKMLMDYKPDMVVCTHFLPAEIISWLNAKEKIVLPQAIVITDLDVHAMWLCHHYEHYFVPLEETRVHMEKLGIDATKITVSGIPIDPLFAQPKDKYEMQAKHGLDHDRVTILLSAGGFGVGSVQWILKSLLELKHRTQVIAVAGKNPELYKDLQEVAPPTNPENVVNVKVLGYTKEMDELMAASDFLLGKSGGLTTAEALARGLKLIIVNPIPGQEERNSDHFLEEGVAIRCNNLPVLAYKIDRLLDDTKRMDIMSQSVIRLARPRSAADVVDKLLEIRGLPGNPARPS